MSAFSMVAESPASFFRSHYCHVSCWPRDSLHLFLQVACYVCHNLILIGCHGHVETQDRFIGGPVALTEGSLLHILSFTSCRYLNFMLHWFSPQIVVELFWIFQEQLLLLCHLEFTAMCDHPNSHMWCRPCIMTIAAIVRYRPSARVQ